MASPHVTAFIGLGSNIGNGRLTLQKAWMELGGHPLIEVEALSCPYLSAPVGMDSDNWFTNAVGRLSTCLSSEQLLQELLKTEQFFGRRRDDSVTGYQDRTLDLDLLYYGSDVAATEMLTLPHPAIAQRLFVLEPLAEIAADFKDPVDGLPFNEKLLILKQQIENGDIAFQEIDKKEWDE